MDDEEAFATLKPVHWRKAGIGPDNTTLNARFLNADDTQKVYEAMTHVMMHHVSAGRVAAVRKINAREIRIKGVALFEVLANHGAHFPEDTPIKWQSMSEEDANALATLEKGNWKMERRHQKKYLIGTFKNAEMLQTAAAAVGHFTQEIPKKTEMVGLRVQDNRVEIYGDILLATLADRGLNFPGSSSFCSLTPA